MTEETNFTKQFLAQLVAPVTGKRLYVYDEKVAGLAIAVTSQGTKTFVVYKKVHGRPQRIKLGRFPGLSIEQARAEAQKLLGKIAVGINPRLEKQEQRSA